MATNLPSFSIHGLVLEEAYIKLDKEINQLQERLCSLKTLRNSLSPISKFPTELLAKIFTDSQDCVDEPLAGAVDVHARFMFSWVCRHWRNTALGTAGLWTILSRNNKDATINIEFADELLARSRHLALSINLFKPTQALLRLFVPHMHRIMHLRLSPGAGESRNPAFDELLSQPAPVLASLELCCTHTPLEPMFSGAHPNLRTLIVTRVGFLSLPPSTFLSLTSLHIIDNDPVIGINDLIGVLPSLPCLSKLKLVQSFQDENFIPLAERLTLPRLQLLTISDECSSAVFDFLACLDVPHTQITLTWPESVYCSAMTMREFEICLDEYRRRIPFPIRHLKIDRHAPSFTIEMSSSPTQHRHSFQFPEKPFDQESFFFGLPLSHLESLSTNELYSGTIKFFKRSTKLSTVTLFGKSALKTFIQKLKLGPEPATKRSFPALRELTICNIKKAAPLDDLREALITRHKVQMGLDRLVFAECPGVDVEGFRGLVDVVSVNK
ncbi:hypothetical protein BDN72DRAFT_847464 [Pluteus cervinus]|uniref:Uncharacterized protein n=1 Tax=Pluteus cervinus TaxID=181527 RepID=A0ACD3ADK0_9AGAR|nr:hypothetical protein BDN72DRAFT_847464 [Pluteus cervinus]